jgi:hypothetical protein
MHLAATVVHERDCEVTKAPVVSQEDGERTDLVPEPGMDGSNKLCRLGCRRGRPPFAL